jgi:perosamine synthetase
LKFSEISHYFTYFDNCSIIIKMTIIRRKFNTYPGYAKDFFRLYFSSDWERGEFVEKFEDKFAKLTGVNHAVCTSYGLHAMALTLAYYNFNSRTKILIPGYTARVVKLCLDKLSIAYTCIDIDSTRSTICLEDFKRKICKDTKGVLVTHLLGNSCNLEIIKIAKEHNLIIIEDCAHAHGAEIEGKKLGSLGHAAFFSFGYSKLINTYTGGILTTNDQGLYNYARADFKNRPSLLRVQLLRKFITGHAEMIAAIPVVTMLLSPILGSELLMKKLKRFVRFITRKDITYFYKYTNTQAYLGFRQLDYLSNILMTKKRQAILLSEKTNLNFLKKSDGDVYHSLIAIVPDAEKYNRALLKMGIDTGHGSNIMDVISPDEKLPGCSFANKHYLMLPNYASLSEKKIKHLIDRLNEVHASLEV